jgi:hypothetical protein
VATRGRGRRRGVTFTGTPSATYTIEFFSIASSTPGQGENYLGSQTGISIPLRRIPL